jgi:hypothetical protein
VRRRLACASIARRLSGPTSLGRCTAFKVQLGLSYGAGAMTSDVDGHVELVCFASGGLGPELLPLRDTKTRHRSHNRQTLGRPFGKHRANLEAHEHAVARRPNMLGALVDSIDLA